MIENVVGAITAREGKDFQKLVQLIAESGYRVGPMVIDAVRFLPQSRPRLFIVAVLGSVKLSSELIAGWPNPTWHPASLKRAWARLPAALQKAWVWWQLPEPTTMTTVLSDLIEEEPTGVAWHTQEETEKLISLMSEVNRKKLIEAQRAGLRTVGAVYRRTRKDENGDKVQRAEARFDGLSGCLRTPAGGSSRQFIVIVTGKKVRSRLLSAREAARLMGVPDDYPLPRNYNEGYHLFGDGLVVPVVGWLNTHLLLKLARATVFEEAA